MNEEAKEKIPVQADRETRNIKGLKVLPVVQIAVKQGKGTPANPYRIDMEYWSLTGELLAVHKGCH